jgi:ATP-dependent RNA helicase DDX3X
MNLSIVFNRKEVISKYDKKSFAELDFHKQLKKNLESIGFDKMSPIQRAVIPYLLEDKDIMGCAQTGSGKTVAFLAPLVNKMLIDGPPESDKSISRGVSAPVALILTPTRDFAEQIFKKTRKVIFKAGIMVAKVYGGVPIEQQIKPITNGCDILVAALGRLIDFLKRVMVTLKSVHFLVFDEADRVLEMGFEDQLNEIILQSSIPEKEKRINMMFSATFTPQVRSIALTFMNDYYFFTSNLDGGNNANENIEQSLIYCEE